MNIMLHADFAMPPRLADPLWAVAPFNIVLRLTILCKKCHMTRTPSFRWHGLRTAAHSTPLYPPRSCGESSRPSRETLPAFSASQSQASNFGPPSALILPIPFGSSKKIPDLRLMLQAYVDRSSLHILHTTLCEPNTTLLSVLSDTSLVEYHAHNIHISIIVIFRLSA